MVIGNVSSARVHWRQRRRRVTTPSVSGWLPPTRRGVHWHACQVPATDPRTPGRRSLSNRLEKSSISREELRHPRRVVRRCRFNQHRQQPFDGELHHHIAPGIGTDGNFKRHNLRERWGQREPALWINVGTKAKWLSIDRSVVIASAARVLGQVTPRTRCPLIQYAAIASVFYDVQLNFKGSVPRDGVDQCHPWK